MQLSPGRRRPIFAALRRLLGRGIRPAEVSAMDAAIDAALAETGAQLAAEASRPSARVNAAARALIKEAEALRLNAYLCPAGKPTIGWGHTGPEVRLGMKIDLPRAEALFEQDLDSHGAFVARLCPVTTIAQFSALTSLAFNIGEGNFAKSSVRRLHNAGDHAGAARAFNLWIKARVKGKLVVLRGLVKRRGAEAAIYLNTPVT